jgi:hypothetical protein
MGWRVALPIFLVTFGQHAPWTWAAELAPATAPIDIRDIRGPFVAEGLPPFALTGGALLLVGGLLIVRRRTRSGVPPPPGVSRHDDRNLLARLVADHRQGACRGDQIVVRLDGILRDSLAEATGIPAPMRTSVELRAEAMTGLNAEQRAWLDDLLVLCDRVKFAGHQPDRAEVDWALSVAASFLDDLPTGGP